MSANPKYYLSPEEYLAIERASREKHEYFDGEVFLMSGGSGKHNAIIFNVSTSLGAQIKGSRCRGFSSDQRVLIDETGLYTYPDATIVCGQPAFADGDTLINPTLIVEILSPSTKGYDTGEKFEHYRKIPSLEEYLIVAQDKPHVMLYTRQSDNTWLLSEAENMNAQIELHSIKCRPMLSDIYDNIDFIRSKSKLREN